MFIVLEGIDGSGTTTQLDRLDRHLRGRGRRVHATREPSTGPSAACCGRSCSAATVGPTAPPVDGLAMALLFAADRRDHLRREIEPALAAGTDVVSDRYLLSSLAYQAEEAERDWVAGLAREVRLPDLTLLLDVPVAVAAARRRAAGRPTSATTTTAFRRASPRTTGGWPAAIPASWSLDGSGPVDAVADAMLVKLPS